MPYAITEKDEERIEISEDTPSLFIRKVKSEGGNALRITFGSPHSETGYYNEEDIDKFIYALQKAKKNLKEVM